VSATAVFAAEAQKSLPVDEIEAQLRVCAGVEDEPSDAGAVRVGAPLRPWSLQLQQSVALLLASPVTTIMTFTDATANSDVSFNSEIVQFLILTQPT